MVATTRVPRPPTRNATVRPGRHDCPARRAPARYSPARISTAANTGRSSCQDVSAPAGVSGGGPVYPLARNRPATRPHYRAVHLRPPRPRLPPDRPCGQEGRHRNRALRSGGAGSTDPRAHLAEEVFALGRQVKVPPGEDAQVKVITGVVLPGGCLFHRGKRVVAADEGRDRARHLDTGRTRIGFDR